MAFSWRHNAPWCSDWQILTGGMTVYTRCGSVRRILRKGAIDVLPWRGYSKCFYLFPVSFAGMCVEGWDHDLNPSWPFPESCLLVSVLNTRSAIGLCPYVRWKWEEYPLSLFSPPLKYPSGTIRGQTQFCIKSLVV